MGNDLNTLNPSFRNATKHHRNAIKHNKNPTKRNKYSTKNHTTAIATLRDYGNWALTRHSCDYN